MKIARVVLVCPCCKHRITDPTVILTTREWRERYGPMRFGCIKCQQADPFGGDVELEEKIEEMDLNVAAHVAPRDCRHHCHYPRVDGTCCICAAPLHNAEECAVCEEKRRHPGAEIDVSDCITLVEEKKP